MKVAVTGASGFIGRHVLVELESRSVMATIVLRPSSSALPSFAKHTATRMDLQNPLPSAFELMGAPDVLIHLAWGGLPNYKSLHHFEQELPAQYRFLKGLVESGLKNLVVTGTCFEYGMQSGPLREEMETRPTNPYGFAKDTLRRQLEYLKPDQPFTLTWARLFYVYGDGQAENSLLPQLKGAVERGDKVFNMSGGEQLRDYLPVTEVAKSLVSLAMGNRDNGIVNICSGKPMSVRKLVEGWIEENGWSIKLNLGHYPYSDYEPMAFWGDRRRLDRCLESQ
ncbi:MAG: NAD(P)-dependent oxidoreductase [candidate division NC10 bacterium]|nr:NAD(P)-dependent oxidoreductase [candidate division NC10 bacterium]MDE2321948.1 NAD(P)-dependent oxidoreductase [candidate division NC10 bacterium]